MICSTYTTFCGIIILTFIVTVFYIISTRQYNNETAVSSKIRAMFKRQQTSERRYFNKSREVLVLYWTRTFRKAPAVNLDQHSWPFFFAGNNCPIKCELTTDKHRVHEAAALVVHARNANEMPPRSYKNLTWIIHTNENPVYTPSLKNPEIMKLFDYSVNYRLDSDFPSTEFVKPSLVEPVPFSKKEGFAIAVMSNCEPVRTYYVSQLMKYIKVDSYGSCLKNKNDLDGKPSRHDVKQLQRNYKFSLIFPNADCDYYMTEKISSALSAGSVPVWLGTDKIDEVLQWGNLNHSVIKVKDFSSPKSLAQYLLSLANNEVEYNKYLKWKYEGFQFPKEYYESPIGIWWDGLPLYCRICMRIAKDPWGHDGIPVDLCEGDQKRTVEKWIKTTELTRAAHRKQNDNTQASTIMNARSASVIKRS